MALFAFLLGAVSSLVVVFILLVNFINKTEEKIEKEYDDTKKALEEPDLQVFFLSPFYSHLFFTTRTKFNDKLSHHYPSNTFFFFFFISCTF
jgi:hypothetical protein